MRDGISQCLSLRRAAVRRGPDHSGQDKPDPGPYSLAKGVAKAVAEDGLLGVLTGGLSATSGGIAAAVVLSLLAALLVRPKEKR